MVSEFEVNSIANLITRDPDILSEDKIGPVIIQGLKLMFPDPGSAKNMRELEPWKKTIMQELAKSGLVDTASAVRLSKDGQELLSGGKVNVPNAEELYKLFVRFGPKAAAGVKQLARKASATPRESKNNVEVILEALKADEVDFGKLGRAMAQMSKVNDPAVMRPYVDRALRTVLAHAKKANRQVKVLGQYVKAVKDKVEALGDEELLQIFNQIMAEYGARMQARVKKAKKEAEEQLISRGKVWKA